MGWGWGWGLAYKECTRRRYIRFRFQNFLKNINKITGGIVKHLTKQNKTKQQTNKQTTRKSILKLFADDGSIM